MDGHVFVLDRASGRLLWHFYGRLADRVVADRAARHRLLRRVERDGCTRSTCARTALRWSRSLGAKITSSAAIADGHAVHRRLRRAACWALSPRTGRTRWVRSVNGRVYGTPAVLHGRVFVPSSTGGSLTAFSTRGRYLWRVGTGSYVYSSPAAWAGRVFFGSYNGVFYGVSAASGRILWRVGTGGPISGAAVVVDGVAYAGSFSHRIVGVDARSGRVLAPLRAWALRSGVRKRDALTFPRVFTSLCSRARNAQTAPTPRRDANSSQHPPTPAAHGPLRARARRLGVALAAVLAVALLARSDRVGDRCARCARSRDAASRSR